MNSVKIFELDLEEHRPLLVVSEIELLPMLIINKSQAGLTVEVLQKSFEELKQARTRDKELFAEAKKRIESNMKKNLSFLR
nr:hypothetical protein [Tanacetum cinerariifolium]